MKQINLPRRLTGRIMMVSTLILLIVALIASFFAPMIRLDTASPEAIEAINEALETIDPDFEDDEIPEVVDVSFVKLLKSSVVLSRVIKVVSNTAKKQNVSEKQLENLKDQLASEDGRDMIVTCVAVANSVVKQVTMNKEAGGIAKVISAIIGIVGLIGLLGFCFVLPISYLVATLKVLIIFFKTIKEPECGVGGAGRFLPNLVDRPLTFMLFQATVFGIALASGIYTLFVVSVLSIVLNILLTRLRSYENEEFVYLNIVQGVSLVSILGFFIFFFNCLKSDFIRGFLSGNWSEAAAIAEISRKYGEDPGSGHIVALAIAAVVIALIFASLKYFISVTQRMSCSAKRDKLTDHVNDTLIPLTVVLLLTGILMIVLTNMTSELIDGEALFVLEDENKSAVVGMIIGAVIALASEIGIIVLKNVFCSKISLETCSAVLTGSSKTPDEKAAEAKKILADAQATVKAAETAEAAAVAETASETKSE